MRASNEPARRLRKQCAYWAWPVRSAMSSAFSFKVRATCTNFFARRPNMISSPTRRRKQLSTATSQHDGGDEAEFHGRSTSTTAPHSGSTQHACGRTCGIRVGTRAAAASSSSSGCPVHVVPHTSTRPPAHHHRGPTSPACSSIPIIYRALSASNLSLHVPSPFVPHLRSARDRRCLLG